MSRDELVLYSHYSLSPSDKRDQALCVTLLRASDDREATMRLLMERRNRYRTWVTVTQRKWQQRGRHRHHDSVEIRERYVRV
jgi:hypothetical protein